MRETVNRSSAFAHRATLWPSSCPAGTIPRAEAFCTGRTSFEWIHLPLSPQVLHGKLVPAHITLVRILYKNDDAVAAYVRDLRELKIQEAQQREAEERMPLMLNTAPLCCNFLDRNFNNIACNDEAVRLFELRNQQDYSIIAGKLDLEQAAFDLPKMLEEAIQPLIPQITDKGLEIIFDFSGDIPTQPKNMAKSFKE